MPPYLVVSKMATNPKRRHAQLDFSPKRCVDLYPVKTATNQNGDNQNAMLTCIQDGDKSKTATLSKQRHAPFWLSPYWLSPFWRVAVLVVVAVLDVSPFWLSPFWSVAVLACRRFGCRRFGFVAVSTCIHKSHIIARRYSAGLQ